MKAGKEKMEDDKALDKPASNRNVPRHVLEAFDNLVPDDPPGQAKAAVVILKHVDQLMSSQSVFKLPEDVNYVVRRLLSGLISNRQRVREGFCSTLQALLQLQPATVSVMYDGLLELTRNKKNISKEEGRNFLTGELLGYAALIRSGQVKNNLAMRQTIINRLFEIQEKKHYYEVIVAHYFVHMMEKLTKSVVHQEILTTMAQDFLIPLEELSPSKLWLRLVILRKFPEVVSEEIADTLKPKNFEQIGAIIVKTSINMPSVHPCLSETISSLHVQGGEAKVILFWEKALVPYLKGPTANCLQLLFNGLQLVLLKLKTAAEIRRVCSEEVITHLVNVMSLHDKNLSASARGVGSALLQLATTNYEQDNSIQLTIAQVLIEKPGSVRFDQLTGTKLLGQMRMHFTPDTTKKVAKLLMKIIVEDKEERLSNKIGSALFLGRLVSQPRMSGPEYDTWRKEQILLLMSMALLTPDMKQIVEQYQDIFFRCLGSNMSRIKEYKVLLEYLHEEAHKAVEESKQTDKPLLTPQAQTIWDKIVAKLAEIRENNNLSSVAADVFQVLYMQMALYLLATLEAKDIIEELDSSYKEAKKCKNSSSKRDALLEFSWVDKVVELLLSLLPHENSLFRSLAQGIFWLLCPLMTPTSLLSVVEVLDPAKQDEVIRVDGDENIEQEEEDDEDEDEDEDTEEEEEAEEEEEDDDDDIEEEDEVEDEEDEEDMEVEEEWSEEEESGNEDDEMLFKLKKEMMAVAGDIEDEVDMDSVPQEELDQMDERLGALVGKFLQHKKKKSLKNKGMEKLQSDEILLMHFRSRVCDLLELYLKEGSDMGLVLSLINPLLTAVIGIDQDRKRQEELLNRMRHLLLMMGRIQKFENIGGATIEFIVEEFNTFFNSAIKMRDEFNPIIRGCYSLFMRCGCQLLGDKAHDSRNMLMQSYLSHLREIFTQNKFNIRTQTLIDICTSDCGGLWSVAELMKEFSFRPKLKCYWRTQAMQILNKLYRNEALLERTDENIIREWERDFSSKTCQMLGPTASLGLIRGQYLAEIFGFFHTIRKREISKKIQSGIEWDEVGSIIVSLRHRVSSKTYKICRGPFTNIINNLGLSKQIAKTQEIAERRRAERMNLLNDLADPDTDPVSDNEENKPDSEQNGKVKGKKIGTKRKLKGGKGGKKLKKGKAKGTENSSNGDQPQKKKRKEIPVDSR